MPPTSAEMNGDYPHVDQAQNNDLSESSAHHIHALSQFPLSPYRPRSTMPRPQNRLGVPPATLRRRHPYGRDFASLSALRESDLDDDTRESEEANDDQDFDDYEEENTLRRTKKSKVAKKTAASATYDYYPAYHTGYGATGQHAHKLSKQLTPKQPQLAYANARSGHGHGHSGYGGGHCKGSGKGSAKGADKGVMAMEMGGDMQLLILAAMAAFLASQLFNSQSRRRRRRSLDGGYVVGDEWEVEAVRQWVRAGIEDEVLKNKCSGCIGNSLSDRDSCVFGNGPPAH